MAIWSVYSFTGTLVKAQLAESVPPTPPPEVVAVRVKVAPGITGWSVHVTGVARAVFPGLPSEISVMDAPKVTEAAVPPGTLTCTVCGLEAEGATAAFSRVTVNVPAPELLANAGLPEVNCASTV